MQSGFWWISTGVTWGRSIRIWHFNVPSSSWFSQIFEATWNLGVFALSRHFYAKILYLLPVLIHLKTSNRAKMYLIVIFSPNLPWIVSQCTHMTFQYRPLCSKFLNRHHIYNVYWCITLRIWGKNECLSRFGWPTSSCPFWLINYMRVDGQK